MRITKKIVYLFLAFVQISTTSFTSFADSNAPINSNSSNVSQRTAADDAEAVKYLLSFEYRPSPRQILKAFGGELPAENPFIGEESLFCAESGQIFKLQSIRQQLIALEDYGPKAIARMEKAYPNASYFQTGRDGALFGDALELFYDLLGEHDRVYRLFASGPTVRALDNKSGPQFLESNGMTKRLGQPVLFVDNTSWNQQSQTYLLTQWAESLLLSKGLKIEQIRKILTTASIHSGWIPENDIDNVDRLIESYYLRSPLYINTSRNQTLYYTFYGAGFWHPSLSSETKKLFDGREVGIIPEDSSFGEDNKRLALAFMYEMMKIISKPTFYSDVKTEARGLGYDFKPKALYQTIKFRKLSPEIIIGRAFQQQRDELRKRIGIQIDIHLSYDSNAKEKELIIDGHFKNRKSDEIELNKIVTSENEIEEIEKIIIQLANKAYSDKTLEISDVQLKDFVREAIESVLPNQVSPAKKISLIIRKLPAFNDQQEKYFSDNGYILSQWLEDAQETDPNVFQAEAGSLLSFITSAYISSSFQPQKISRKDFRRLVLQIFAYASESKSIKSIEDEVSNNYILSQMLTERYEVFLTSDKYKSAGKKTYERLVQAGLLPQPQKTCEDLLEAKKKDKKLR